MLELEDDELLELEDDEDELLDEDEEVVVVVGRLGAGAGAEALAGAAAGALGADVVRVGAGAAALAGAGAETVGLLGVETARVGVEVVVGLLGVVVGRLGVVGELGFGLGNDDERVGVDVGVLVGVGLAVVGALGADTVRVGVDVAAGRLAVVVVALLGGVADPVLLLGGDDLLLVAGVGVCFADAVGVVVGLLGTFAVRAGWPAADGDRVDGDVGAVAALAGLVDVTLGVGREGAGCAGFGRVGAPPAFVVEVLAGAGAEVGAFESFAAGAVGGALTVGDGTLMPLGDWRLDAR